MLNDNLLFHYLNQKIIIMLMMIVKLNIYIYNVIFLF